MTNILCLLGFGLMLATAWCAINMLVPIRKYGIKSRKAAFGLLVIVLPTTIFCLTQFDKARLAELKVSDPNAYLAEVRDRQGDAAYLVALKDLDPKRWKAEAPAIEASLHKQQQDDMKAKQAKSQQAADTNGGEYADGDEVVTKGITAVLDKLKDPSSAKFQNMFFHMATISKKKVPMSCGEVNSRNGFGGYNGYRRYISAGYPELTYLEEEVTDFNKAWKLMCVN
jgi:hypothetical protein